MLGATPELLVLGTALERNDLPDVFTLPESRLEGVWLVDPSKVRLDDLVAAGNRPGAIVRVRDMDAIRYIPSRLDGYERVAGMISDAA